jgi:hypothetical protein
LGEDFSRAAQYDPRVPRRDKASKPDPVIPATQEEIRQLDELAFGHPWQLTLSEFLKRVASEYGFELCGMETGSPYLKSPELGRVIHLPGTLHLDEQLEPVVTASLCRRLRIPPEDFGLPQQGPEAEGYDED